MDDERTDSMLEQTEDEVLAALAEVTAQREGNRIWRELSEMAYAEVSEGDPEVVLVLDRVDAEKLVSYLTAVRTLVAQTIEFGL